MTVAISQHVLEAADDVSGLTRQIAAWGAARIARLAILARVEGEYTDGSRERARAAVFGMLARHGLAEKAEMVTVVGCEGLVTPYCLVLADVEGDSAPSAAKRLAIGLAHGASPEDGLIDTAAFKTHVAGIVRRAMADAGLVAADVATVIVNTPQPATGDAWVRGRKARAVAALGAGIALGEIADADVTEATLVSKGDLHTHRVQSFAGPTVKQIEVIVLGNRAGAGGDLVACSTVADNLTDLRPLKRMLLAAGLALDADGEIAAPDGVAAFILKSGVPPDGRIMGRRTTLLGPGLPVEKHVRAAQSGLVAGLLGTTCAFSTFDPVQQCPVGGSAACAIVRVA